MVRELLQLHLRNEGYRVEVAEDAIAGGHAVLRSPPDLLICDVNMPHMDGLAFVETLRADPTVARFPVVFLTGEDQLADRGKALGAKAYLTKPIMKDLLLSTVRKALRS